MEVGQKVWVGTTVGNYQSEYEAESEISRIEGEYLFVDWMDVEFKFHKDSLQEANPWRRKLKLYLSKQEYLDKKIN